LNSTVSNDGINVSVSTDSATYCELILKDCPDEGITNVFTINRLSDLPTPIDSVITITQSGKYIFGNSIDFGLNRIELAAGVEVTFIAPAFYMATLTFYGDSVTHIKGLGQNIFINETITMISIGDSDTLINMIDGQVEAIRGDLYSVGNGSLAIKTTATTAARALYIQPEIIAGFEKAIDTDGFVFADIQSVILIQDTLASYVPLIDINNVIQAEMFKVNATTTDTGCVVCIDSVNIGKITLRDIGNTGTGNFFCPTSLDQDSKYVTVVNCGDELDSKSRALVNWNGNTTDTPITQGTYGDIVIDTTTINAVELSRFTLSDSAIVEFTYNALNTSSFRLDARLETAAAPVQTDIYSVSFTINDVVIPANNTTPHANFYLRQAGESVNFSFEFVLDREIHSKCKLMEKTTRMIFQLLPGM
jgi:hypothetical protein